MPICSWQVGSTWLTSILLMVRSFDISNDPIFTLMASCLVTFRHG